ncbi:adenylate/guanylate cyclase domain-containing protein [Carboxylicivirga marina]|uniref:adenylate/guanylate cyclase domain-containing protein n=1 Tax=Carboxylicivirga marina TaxID=2800988 RepID=UPI00259261D4|nr:adenylate/guanylate cyclase domain-containing protein [uncultured Carboxylicivirga sp.]
MFSVEKIKIWFSIFFRSYLYHQIFWLLALAGYAFFTQDERLFVNYLNLLEKNDIYGNTVLLSFFAASFFTFLDAIFIGWVVRKLPIRIIAFFRHVLYVLLALLIIFLSANQNLTFEELRDYDIYFDRMPELGIRSLRFTLWFYLSCIFSTLIRGILRKIGLSNVLQWLMGTLNKPQVEKRIFMFVDMRSSVTIAEKLQHKKFSYLVQDVFNDLAVVENYGGAIYQYLGDGAIISWSLKKGIRNNNCLKAFFAFQKVIKRNRFWYNKRYGLVPEFKAGLHVGDIMVLQVGRLKRDISYNGDTLNTTARIESMCNEYKQDLLISGILYESLPHIKKFNTKEVGNLKLKGKSRGVQVYKVKLPNK